MFTSGSGSPARTVRVSVADVHWPGARLAAKLPDTSPRSVSLTEVRVTGKTPALQISMVYVTSSPIFDSGEAAFVTVIAGATKSTLAEASSVMSFGKPTGL